MPWGTFTPQHIATLLISAALIVGIHFLLRGRTPRVQTAVLFVLSFGGIAAVIFNLLMWGFPLEYLPLHMCSINAILLPVLYLGLIWGITKCAASGGKRREICRIMT